MMGWIVRVLFEVVYLFASWWSKWGWPLNQSSSPCQSPHLITELRLYAETGIHQTLSTNSLSMHFMHWLHGDIDMSCRTGCSPLVWWLLLLCHMCWEALVLQLLQRPVGAIVFRMSATRIPLPVISVPTTEIFTDPFNKQFQWFSICGDKLEM